MKLYYSPGACSLADHIALHEAGIVFDRVKVDLRAKLTETGEDFTRINPKGYVPALTLDNGETLTENIAVLSYVADLSGKLMPGSGMPHWRVLETLAFISTELHKSFKPFFRGAGDTEKAEAAKFLFQRFSVMADRLGDRDFIVGDQMSVADCYLFVMLLWAEKMGVEIPEKLVAYRDRLKQRPAVKLAFEHEGLA